MFKKCLCCFCFMFLFAGCSNSIYTSPKKEVMKKDITCYVDDSSFVLKLEDGQIVKYIDSVDGELGQETVDILNQEHLVGISDNDVAQRIMSDALSDLNGYCE